jgi:hypothetical protein
MKEVNKESARGLLYNAEVMKVYSRRKARKRLSAIRLLRCSHLFFAYKHIFAEQEQHRRGVNDVYSFKGESPPKIGRYTHIGHHIYRHNSGSTAKP